MCPRLPATLPNPGRVASFVPIFIKRITSGGAMSRIQHGTLSAEVETEITHEGNAETVYIFNRTGSSEIYSRADDGDLTVEGEDCEVVPAAIGWVEFPLPGDSPYTVRLLSSGTPSYTVKFV